MKSPFLGYSDKISVLPGERVEFKLSTDLPTFDATLVKLRGVDYREGVQELITDPVEGVGRSSHPGREQSLDSGSYAQIDDGSQLELAIEGSVRAYVFPTLLGAGKVSAILSRWDEDTGAGWWLGIDGDLPTLRLSDGTNRTEVRGPKRLESHTWCCVSASWNATSGTAEIAVRTMVNPTNSRRSPLCEDEQTEAAREEGAGPVGASAPTLIGAHWNSVAGRPGGHFNGKIERPAVWAATLDAAASAAMSLDEHPGSSPIAEWDFAAAIDEFGVGDDRCHDIGPLGLHGRLFGQPSRAVTGMLWDGRNPDFKTAPEQYGAIHFHEDDVDDVGWETDVRVTVPESAESGLYALHVRGDSGEDYFPLWVRARPEAGRRRVLFLFPTFTYMAYANDREGLEGDMGQALVAHTYVLTQMNLRMASAIGAGYSLYDVHADGSGVGYSSRLRPIPNMRPHHWHPGCEVWGLPADMHILDWLNHSEVEFDVATDEDLAREGADLLARYEVVLTGTHPEYCNERCLDSFEQFVGGGGRVMYLGGNGFYWVTTPHPDKPHIIEVRRGITGTRAWESAPGELYHAFTGELGGLWRHRGRAPQKLFGVGFAGQGFDRSSPYRTLSDWADPSIAWAVEGIEEVEILGAFGLVGDGAAGHELDRYDLSLGTPTNARALATSAGLQSENFTSVVEEVLINHAGTTGLEDPMVRSDVVLYSTPGGGAVFATGSIAWAGSLSHANYENDVSALTLNVLNRFLDQTPIEELNSQ
jgi:N,N-dimethylformamidase